jgi:DNA polymerase-3 subunit gamma/tau
VSYLVLARKYRPQSFEDLVGQSHVAKTLANAIAQNRVAHAFLFTGVRGVGKTTSARLLAKCLNCLGADGKATGPTATPCQVCAACTEIAKGTDIDVQEIDGASYNGVDEVRKLQESIGFRPARDRYKVYIVDEVHMLSNAAWNAFLKTLEEPPPHVKFLFATTEVHKVPVTILSRCQRYDFKLISAQTVAARLRDVLGQEKIQADEAAIAILAREAAGSMRDAMSLLDQVIAFGGDHLRGEDVARVLGVADRTVLHALASSLLEGNAAKALSVIHEVAEQGFDVPHVAKDFLAHLRHLVVARTFSGRPDEELRPLLDLADEELKDVRAVSERFEADDLSRLYQGFSKSFDDVTRSGQPRAALEMALVRLARRPALLPLDTLLSRLGDLEKRLASGTPGAPPPRGGGGGRAGGNTYISSETPSADAVRAPSETPFHAGASRLSAASETGPPTPMPVQAPVVAPKPAPRPSTPPRNPDPFAPPPEIFDGPPSPPPAPARQPAPAPRPAPVSNFAGSRDRAPDPFAPPPGLFDDEFAVNAPEIPETTGFSEPARARPRPSARPEPFTPSRPDPFLAPPDEIIAARTAPRPPPEPREPRPKQEFVPVATPAQPFKKPEPARAPLTAEQLGLVPPAPIPAAQRPDEATLTLLRQLVDETGHERADVAALVAHAAPLMLGPGRVVLGFKDREFMGVKASDPEAVAVVSRAATRCFATETPVTIDEHPPENARVSLWEVDDWEARRRLVDARRTIADHPLVKRTIELFGADLREIRLADAG